MTERWRPVPGWEGAYSVSDHGRVRSEPRVVVDKNGVASRKPGKMLRQIRIDQYGHLRVVLHRPGQRHQIGVHRLVLEAFVGPCPSGLETLHWDDDPSNNHVSNLRWGTLQENCDDKMRNGHHRQANQTHCASGHEFTPENTYIRYYRPGGGRQCKECTKLRKRERRARLRQAKATGEPYRIAVTGRRKKAA